MADHKDNPSGPKVGGNPGQRPGREQPKPAKKPNK